MDFSIKRNDFPYLDGLRALAAMIVVVSHFGIQGWANIGGISLIYAGKSGVYLFFLLSAYLLTRVILFKGKSFWSWQQLSKFFFRRSLRIFPLFSIFLLFCVATTKLSSIVMENPRGFPYSLHWADFWRHLFLQDGIGVLWSVPVEFKFYFLLPFLALGLRYTTLRSPALTIGLVAIFCSIVEIYLLSQEGRGGGVYLRAYIQIFVIGSAFAAIDVGYFSANFENNSKARRVSTGIFWISAVALVLMIPSVQEVIFGDVIVYFNRQYLIQGLAWLGILVGLRFGSPQLRAPFEWRWSRYLGLISFSLYLWHTLVVDVLMTIEYSGSGYIGWILPMALSITISHLSFQMIERPFLSIDPAKVWARLASNLAVVKKRFEAAAGD